MSKPHTLIAVLIDKPRTEGRYKDYESDTVKRLGTLLGDDRYVLAVIYACDIPDRLTDEFSVVYVGGGSVFSQQTHLGEEGMRHLALFVKGGGGYLGICAGALLAGAGGFVGAQPGHSLLGAETHYLEGKGAVTVNLTLTGQVVAKRRGWQDDIHMTYSHGARFVPADNRQNTLVGVRIPAAVTLAVFTHLTRQSGGDAEKVEVTGVPIVQGQFGRGRVIAIGPHPETSTDETARGLVKTFVEWVSRQTPQGSSKSS